jgi:hypothetical protein
MNRAGAHARYIVVGALLLACATEQQDAGPDEATPSSAGRGAALGGSAGAGKGSAPGSAGKSSTDGGEVAGSGEAGKSAHGGSGGSGGSTTAVGEAGTGGNSHSSGSSGATSGGSAGSAGQAGAPNQPTQCDEATATLLGSMSSNVSVASNVCLKMVLPADQSWIKKITLQPEGGVYPLPFSWSNCGTNSNAAFTANYANAVLNPVTAECPIFVKLGGSGSPVNVQWWGG